MISKRQTRRFCRCYAILWACFAVWVTVKMFFGLPVTGLLFVAAGVVAAVFVWWVGDQV